DEMDMNHRIYIVNFEKFNSQLIVLGLYTKRLRHSFEPKIFSYLKETVQKNLEGKEYSKTTKEFIMEMLASSKSIKVLKTRQNATLEVQDIIDKLVASGILEGFQKIYNYLRDARL